MTSFKLLEKDKITINLVKVNNWFLVTIHELGSLHTTDQNDSSHWQWQTVGFTRWGKGTDS